VFRKVKAFAAGVLVLVAWTAVAGLATGHAQASSPVEVPKPDAEPTKPDAEPPVPQASARSTVYSIHNAASIREFVADSEEVHRMVDRLVLAATGKENIADAWRSLVSPKDVVGIKISSVGLVHKALVARIVEGLMEAGVPRENILVWDRDASDLRAAGYLERDGKTSAFICPVLSIEPKYGYDPKDTYSAPFLGKLIWGDLLFKGMPVPADDSLSRPNAPLSDPFARLTKPGAGANTPAATPNLRIGPSAKDENLSNVSHYCNIIAHRVTKIIDVPVFSDNSFVGVGGALYNVTIPNVDNWRRLVGPPQFGQTTIPEMFSDPQIGGRVVLSITDGLIAQIAGGPQFDPLYARHLGTLYASKDAVALDSVVLRYLESWRAQAQLPPLGDKAGHVRTAGEMGLGNASPDRIDLRALNP
jgi:hypothetical protein